MDSGSFTLYEDDNISNDYQEEKCARTTYKWQEEEGSLYICSAEGEVSLIPEKRDYIIAFCGVKDAQITGKVLSLQGRVCRDNEVTNRCFQILDRMEIEYAIKENIFDLIERQTDTTGLLGELLAMELDRDLCSALAEIITA